MSQPQIVKKAVHVLVYVRWKETLLFTSIRNSLLSNNSCQYNSSPLTANVAEWSLTFIHQYLNYLS